MPSTLTWGGDVTDHPCGAWDLAKDDAMHLNQKFGSYGFRHRYAKASHAAGFPPMAESWATPWKSA